MTTKSKLDEWAEDPKTAEKLYEDLTDGCEDWADAPEDEILKYGALHLLKVAEEWYQNGGNVPSIYMRNLSGEPLPTARELLDYLKEYCNGK